MLWVSSCVSAGAVVIGPTLQGDGLGQVVACDEVYANVLISVVGTWFPSPETIPQVSGLVLPPFVVRRHIAPLHTAPGLGSGPVQGPKVLGLTSGVRTLQMTLPA